MEKVFILTKETESEKQVVDAFSTMEKAKAKMAKLAISAKDDIPKLDGETEDDMFISETEDSFYIENGDGEYYFFEIKEMEVK